MLPVAGLVAYGSVEPAVWAYYKKSLTWQYGYLGTIAPGIGEKLSMFFYLLANSLGEKRESGLFVTALFVPAVVATSLVYCLSSRRGRVRQRPTQYTAALALSLLFVSVAASIMPGRPFLHYILTHVPFLCFAYGLTILGLCEVGRQRGLLVFAAAAAMVFLLSALGNPKEER